MNNIILIFVPIIIILISFLWSYINCLLCEWILDIYDKWNIYQINRMIKQIKKMQEKEVEKDE